MERELIAERTRTGLEALRKRGRVGGRPRVDGKAIVKIIPVPYSSAQEYSEQGGLIKTEVDPINP